MANRLAGETSPYLLQHKDNPVDWYPWGEEAFSRARAEDRPILLSVGYSACHWCHVMAHESFEDEEIAGLMNQWFVNVKVDREERPDVDGVYMSAVQAMTGSGGWPMTVFMTPDLRPFYSGTYFPPGDGHGRPGFPRVLEALHDAWLTERDRLLASAEGITEHITAIAKRHGGTPGSVGEAEAEGVIGQLRDAFDAEFGGFGQAPKFPSPSNLEFLLTHHARSGGGSDGEPSAVQMALTTLVRMAQGGMYDQLGGGFSRYSVDRYWLVPHFEKMLYDNAQLVRTYLHAFQLTNEPFFRRIVEETLAYLEREMRNPEGGFYAAQDADSEGIEGKFFVWTPGELDELLAPDDGALAAAWYGVTERGNFEDPHHREFGRRNVLTAWDSPEEVAAKFGLDAQALEGRIANIRGKLFAARDQRVHPGLDDKALTSWNGLALAAFAEAGRVLGNRHYVEVAGANAMFLRENLWRDGRLLHTWKAGIAKVDGMLEDYAYVALGLVELYRATGEFGHLDWARELFEVVLARFRDDSDGLFFETPHDAENLLVRQKSLFDSATPGSCSATAMAAFWLGRYFEREEWTGIARSIVESQREFLVRAPTGFGTLWQVAELLMAPRQELVIVGAEAGRSPFEREAAREFRPWLVLAPGLGTEPLPLFEGRGSEIGARAFVCEDMACQLPAGDVETMRAQLVAL